MEPSSPGEEHNGQQTESNAAQDEPTSNPTTSNDPVVSIEIGSYDEVESLGSEEDFAHDGLQSGSKSAAGSVYTAIPPTATENSPTVIPAAGSPILEEDQSIGSSLKTKLNKALIESHYDKTKCFLPRSEIGRLVHPESIKSYWLAHTEHQYHDKCTDVINYVCGTRTGKSRQGRLVFVVLLFIDEPALILDIIKDEVYDDDLPLVFINKQGTDFQLARKTSKKGPIKCFDKWKTTQRLAFENLQWQVTATVFSEVQKSSQSSDLQVIELDDRGVLPLTEYDAASKYQGNSEVVRVKIHKAHHKFNPGVCFAFEFIAIYNIVRLCLHTRTILLSQENESFALKSLKSEDQVGFKLEAKALAKIRPRPHLVSVLAAFKYQNKYHLLFRWAEGGNLANFWSQQDLATSHNTVCWFAEQCHGLVDGLDGIHNAKLSETEVDRVIRHSATAMSPIQSRTSGDMLMPFVRGDDKDCGRHGDIKPQNILWFKQDSNQYGHGVLKISDFGLTTFHSALTTKVGNIVPVTLSYAAPERVIDSDLSRPFDIWSLGCVYLEFITWLLLGSKQLEEFKKKRLGKKDDRTKFETDEFYSVYRETNRTYATVKEPVTEVSLPPFSLDRPVIDVHSSVDQSPQGAAGV